MPDEKQSDPWFVCLRRNPEARMRFFCFPYAGGDAGMFRAWSNLLPAFVQVYAARLPGRGGRIKEPPFTHLAPLVAAVEEAIGQYLDKPFAFFGHSMGALISITLAFLLRKKRGLEPAHLFISGRRAPQIPETDPPTYHLPEKEFIEELRRLNGTPKEVLDHPELMQIMMPLLRADFSVCQTFNYSPEPPLNCPITAFGGVDDEISREDMDAWRVHTTSAFSLKLLPGDHFFLHDARTQIVQIIGGQLEQAARLVR